jgi:hypothetical protein
MFRHSFCAAALLMLACSNTPQAPAAPSAALPAPAAAPLPVEPAPAAPMEAQHAEKQPIAQQRPASKRRPAPVAVPVPVAAPTAPSPEVQPPAPAIEQALPTNIHQAFDDLLQRHVGATGQVNYRGLKKDKAALDAYCAALSARPIRLDSSSRAEQMAFWINAYNAFTLQLIVENYPTKSIMNFDGGKTWDVKRIRIGSNKYSLNNIENDILRPQFKDPRIHFAVNCAARSCPPLHNRAYTAENLEETLEARTRAFVNNSAFNQIGGGKAKLSKIFEWYATDFGDLVTFLNKYSNTPLRRKAALSFDDYDWGLNE